MPSPDIQPLIDAAGQFDREEAAARVAELVAQVEELDFASAEKALRTLRNKRWFPLLVQLGKAVSDRPGATYAARKFYAQGLIDDGQLNEAIAYLRQLADDCASDSEAHGEALGLLGRAYKQVYVAGRGDEWLRKAIVQYHSVYEKNRRGNFWHGINAAALLALAERRGVSPGIAADFRTIAAEILRTIQDVEDNKTAGMWHYATAAEACVALGDWAGARDWMVKYLPLTKNDVFEVGSSLRQLTEVWELSLSTPGNAAALIYLLQADLLQKDGGASFNIPATAESLTLSPANAEFLQVVFGTEGFIPHAEYQVGLARAANVARIGLDEWVGKGTGFLLRAADLDDRLDGWVLLTCWHVIPRDVHPQLAYVVFEALPERPVLRVKEVLWESDENHLDATILRLAGDVPGITASYPIIEDIPPVTPKSHVNIIGHPLGGPLQFSVSDNILLDHQKPKMHYRTPTHPGSSGSPAFFRPEWKLVALHHAGKKVMSRLNGKPGTYSANEGIYIGSIIEAFRNR